MVLPAAHHRRGLPSQNGAVLVMHAQDWDALYKAGSLGEKGSPGLSVQEKHICILDPCPDVQHSLKPFNSEQNLCLQGVASRDIKLENTLLDGSPRPLLKICDFGYSKLSGN